MSIFKIKSDYTPSGDQPNAIQLISQGIIDGIEEQTLLGVTGSGKTFTVANIIQNIQKPTLVLAHNKTLAAQLCSELREFFPDNAVEFFVSYYDYYQPEAYVAVTDTYIEKDSKVNEEIDRLRHSATSALFERKDVIIVSSVSCIYSLGDPIDYSNLVASVRTGMNISRDDLINKLISIQYERNDIDFARNRFRVRGDTVEIQPSHTDDYAYRVEFFGDEIDKISQVDGLTGSSIKVLTHCVIFPASHYVTTPERMEKAIIKIEKELEDTVKKFKQEDKLIEAQRIEQRTRHDIEMMREIGFCSGIENYSSILSEREKGSVPFTLMDYFPDDYLMVIDESHVMLPQVRAMYHGDRARKTSLVENGFRLPSAMDNRPMTFDEFNEKLNKVIYVSATPSEYEKSRSGQIVEQLIRPTGLLDPIVEIRPISGQIYDIINEIKIRVEKHERVLLTTLTKRMSEDITTYLAEQGIKIRYLHSDIKTMERMELLRDLRLGVFDVLVGINLLREGLDLPEVSLVCILDADKEGFLRSETALIQTIGRAARNSQGKVIMYADNLTGSMERAIGETNRRRELQIKYNEENNITPATVIKSVRDIIEISSAADSKEKRARKMGKRATDLLIKDLTGQMKEASKMLEFEVAARLRDRIQELKEE